MPLDDILMDCEEHMEKAVEHLRNELRAIRTGRATPALVEHLKVDYYGSPTDLRSIASISVPEATQILIKPFTPQDLKSIEKAINDSKLGLKPSQRRQNAAAQSSRIIARAPVATGRPGQGICRGNESPHPLGTSRRQ